MTNTIVINELFKANNLELKSEESCVKDFSSLYILRAQSSAVMPDPDKPGRYRLLDGAHRWSAYKSTGVTETEAVIKNLDGRAPLLYAAKKAIGPQTGLRGNSPLCKGLALNLKPVLFW